MNSLEYIKILTYAKEHTLDMDIFFAWLEAYPNFADDRLNPIEIELSFLCYNIAFDAYMYGAFKK
jgi:hypothetical protein